ncbi:MAG TPA: hypothetical protein VNL77_14940 [Roseiflexaceae bacterium]|nr:hypothetical protein [Roseiflexaceae bacterium]
MVWEMVHHLVRTLNGGELAAELLRFAGVRRTLGETQRGMFTPEDAEERRGT